MNTLVSRVFMNGNSQAVRIPHEFRLDASKVEITKNENGDLIIHAIPEDRGQALMKVLNSFDKEYVAVLEEEQKERPPMQGREPL